MIHDLYAHLLKEKLTDSQVHFSTVWLDRSPRYYSNLIATQREPGMDTLCALNLRLLSAALNTHDGDVAMMLLDLKEKVGDEIHRRIFCSLPRRRNEPSNSGSIPTAPPPSSLPFPAAHRPDAANLSF